MRGKGGRPSKLTPEVKEKLISAIRMGNYYEPACAYAGVDYSTFRRWMQKGEQARSGQYREFYEEVKRAEAEAEARAVALWQKQAPEDWRAARDFLARRYPERWAARDSLRLKADAENPPLLKVVLAHAEEQGGDRDKAASGPDGGV